MITKIFYKMFDFKECDDSVVFQRSDAALAFIYLAYHITVAVIYNLAIFEWGILKNYSRSGAITTYKGLIANIVISCILVIPIFLIICFRKQGIQSVGINIKKTGKDVFWGLICSLPVLVIILINDAIIGETLNRRFDYIVIYFIRTLIFTGLLEELIFRGYFQPRFLSLMKNKYFGVLIVGIIFFIWHIPFKLIRGEWTGRLFSARYLILFLLTVLTHIYLTFVYNRHKSIIAPAIVHAVNNTALLILI